MNNQQMEQAIEPEQPENHSIVTTIRNILFQIFMSYFMYNLLFKRPKSNVPVNTNLAFNSFTYGETLYLYTFISANQFANSSEDAELVGFSKDLKFMDWSHKSQEIQNIDIPVTPELLNNGSLYLIACVSKEEAFPKFSSENGYVGEKYACKIQNLIKMKTIKKSLKKNLVSGKYSKYVENDFVSPHWHPNLTLNIIYENSPQSLTNAHEMIRSFIQFSPDLQFYFPIIYICDYWNLGSDYTPITKDNKSLNLHLTINPLSFLKWQIYLGMTHRKQPFSVSTEDTDDELKRMLVGTPIYLLVLTVVVSVLHSIFEFLAFKNDIQFWRKRDDLTGLSISNILFGVFQSTIVFLYIFDNDANFMVLIGSFVGCLIELWKITKILNYSVDHTRKIGPFPFISISFKSSYTESHTKEYDRQAIMYLSILILPLFSGYSVYSLIYYEHKGWYSFCLSLIYGFLLTFGFIMMTPQLFINYKLKSVAHLPWRMLTYKALNTFIDDIFAFVIHTPFMYRIGCLRDDIIFFIYLYQRWIYPTDKTRVNEFGTCSVDETDEKPKIE